jgi:Zn-dependent dipeptidase, microsomal dipeptidase homolog
VIGVNSVLVSPKKEESTLDRYVDHIEYIANLIGIDGVGVGFDFFEFYLQPVAGVGEEKSSPKSLQHPISFPI